MARITVEDYDPNEHEPEPDEPPDDGDAQPATSHASTLGCFALLAVPVIAVGALAWSCTANTADPDDGSTAPLLACKQAVEGQVKNPDSIDWHTLDTTIGKRKITGSLDAQNVFGATKTLSYTCSLDQGDNVTAVNVWGR